MKLITKQSITYYDCICTGSMNSYEENKPLAKLLKRFDENEVGHALQDEALSKFANGLISNFESEGLMNSGALTPKAKEIIKNQKAWRPLRGQFKMSIVQDGNSCYIVNCEPYYSDNTMGCQLNKTEFQFVGDYENDVSMLEMADIGYAVSNATELCLKAADRITVSNNENAIAVIIRELEEELL